MVDKYTLPVWNVVDADTPTVVKEKDRVWRGGPKPRRAWTEEEDAKLRRDWARKVSIEVIAEELDRFPSDVKRRRKHLGLPVRRFINKRTNVKVNVEADVRDAVGRRARERGQSVSDYIRALIVRDLS